MPKSCLLVFPHCERKRQNSPFQIGIIYFRFFFLFALAIQYFLFAHFLPQTGLSERVLNKNSVNRYWVAMALSHRKRPMQFVSSYSFEKVAVLGRIILLLPPGLHSWHALRLRSGCSGPPGYTMLYTCLPLVSTCVPLVSYSPACRVMCLMCLNSTHHFGFLPSFLPSFVAAPSFLPFSFCFFWSLFVFFWALFVFLISISPPARWVLLDFITIVLLLLLLLLLLILLLHHLCIHFHVHFRLANSSPTSACSGHCWTSTAGVR